MPDAQPYGLPLWARHKPAEQRLIGVEARKRHTRTCGQLGRNVENPATREIPVGISLCHWFWLLSVILTLTFKEVALSMRERVPRRRRMP
jgi:hypothetical protein